MAREYPTLLELVGKTPLVRLQNVVPEGSATVVAKLEYLNPGGSIKDRIAITMVDAAEREGKLKPGGTIVEPTSGNTGTGLAIVAALRGYRCIFTMPDKMSREKISLLKAFGAEVIVCPYAVAPESPESYYSVSDRLAEEIPGAFKPDQYRNEGNPRSHYETTGPEIWEQTGGELDALVIAVGTGGTITGTRALPEGAEPRPDDRRRRPRRLDLHRRPGEAAPVPGRGDRRGLLPGDLRPVRGRPLGDRRRPRVVPHRAPARAGGGPARRRLGRHGGLGGDRDREGARARQDGRHALPRRRPRLPVEVLRRQLPGRARLPRARGAGAEGARGAAVQAAERARARADHDRVAPEGRRGDRPDARVLDLAAAGDAARLRRLARRRGRLAAGARPARARLPQPRRAERGGRGRDAAAARGGRGRGVARRGLLRAQRRQPGGGRRQPRHARPGC